MIFGFPALFLFIALLWPALCSKKRSRASKDFEHLKLTRQSLFSFTCHLKSVRVELLARKLQQCPRTNSLYQLLCLKYLAGSAIVFGHVDEDALSVLCELCKAGWARYLSELLDKMTRENDLVTVALFVAKGTGYIDHIRPVSELIRELVEKDWDAVRALVVKVLTLLETFADQYAVYAFMVAHLPVERQYNMFAFNVVHVSVLNNYYFVDNVGLELREIFALSRCAYNPSPRIRRYIAHHFPHFQQFLADNPISSIVPKCPDRMPALNADVWHRIFAFLDAETLTFVLPLVCTLWCRLQPRALTWSTTVHGMYLQDLRHFGLKEIGTIVPWRRCLLKDRAASEYLGRCIVDGALTKTEPSTHLKCTIARYLESVMDDETLLPGTRSHASMLDSFLKVSAAAYKFCHPSDPVLKRPKFLTNEEYKQVIYHLVYEQRWILKLPRKWLVDNMSQLFNCIEGNAELMTGLVRENFGNFTVASFALIIHSQTNGIPERLAQLIFAQTRVFRGLVEPEFIQPCEYCVFIVSHDLLPEVVSDDYMVPELSQLIVSLILFFKSHPDMIDRIVASLTNKLPGHREPFSAFMRRAFQTLLNGSLRDESQYAPEDLHIIEAAMARLG